MRAEVRGYFEGTGQRFDLIFLPSVGSYPQMMIEPETWSGPYKPTGRCATASTEQGILAIWYPNGLDSKGILTEQYVRTLRSLGMKTEAYRNDVELLILAARDPRRCSPP